MESIVDKIDVDSFIQVYRDIDDLFEDDDEEELSLNDEVKDTKGGGRNKQQEETIIIEGENVAEDDELEQTFATLCKQDSSSISFSQLRQWEEITLLIEEEGTLGEDELTSLWESSLNVRGTDGDMNMKQFIAFNSALDELI